VERTQPTAAPALLEMYQAMVLVREVEQALVRLFAENRVPGFLHSYIGEEATAVGVCAALREDDYITSTHRGHGHIVAKGADLGRFFAEIYGKEAGYCKVKGGSMHVADPRLGILGANGIVGGGIPIAAGAALAARLRGLDRVAVSFFGDGATDIGAFHEALNLASLWDVPVVFVCENNGFAEFTPQQAHQRIDHIADRAAGYSMPGVTVDGNDVEAVYSAAAQAVARARGGAGPTLVECVTFRRRGHYEGDPQAYRQPGRGQAGEQDPIAIARGRLAERGELDEAADAQIGERARAKVGEAVAFAEAAATPDPASALTDVYAGRAEEGWQR